MEEGGWDEGGKGEEEEEGEGGGQSHEPDKSMSPSAALCDEWDREGFRDEGRAARGLPAGEQ